VVSGSAAFTDPAGRDLTHTGGGGTFDDGFNEGLSEGQVTGFSNGQYGYGVLDYSYLETKRDGTVFGNGFFDGYINGYNLGYSMAYQGWGAVDLEAVPAAREALVAVGESW
jgi:hypothetical protein